MFSLVQRSTLAKYIALQLPGLILVVLGLSFAIWRFDLSLPLAGGIVALWIAKDAALYPLLRIAYEPGEADPSAALVGALGTARARIDPDGWVKIGSELWRARLSRDALPIEDGSPVRVVAVDGLTLDVEGA